MGPTHYYIYWQSGKEASVRSLARARHSDPVFHSLLPPNLEPWIIRFHFVSAFGTGAVVLEPSKDAIEMVFVSTRQSRQDHSINESITAYTAGLVVSSSIIEF
jgi:hypothetical protein